MSEQRDVDTIITEILNSLGVPVERQHYTGNGNEFITFQIVLSREVDFSDDVNGGTEYLYRVDVYSKTNFINLLRRTMRALKNADFYGISADPEVYEIETGYYHIPIEVKILEVETWQQ